MLWLKNKKTWRLNCASYTFVHLHSNTDYTLLLGYLLDQSRAKIKMIKTAVIYNMSKLSFESDWLLIDRQALGSGYLASGELQSDPGYSSRGQYGDDIPSSSRPRPVGGSTGRHLSYPVAQGRCSVHMLMFLICVCRCTVTSADTGRLVQSDWCVSRSGTQCLRTLRIQLDSVPARRRTLQTWKHPRGCEYTSLIVKLVMQNSKHFEGIL